MLQAPLSPGCSVDEDELSGSLLLLWEIDHGETLRLPREKSPAA